MIELGPQATKIMDDFTAALGEVRTLADMFPPDFPEDGVREPRRPRVPPYIGCTCLALANVYDSQVAHR